MQVVNPSTAVAPTVVAVQRFGYHMQQTSFVLTFSTALDPASAQNVNNYTIVTLGGPGVGGNLIGHVTHIASAVYDPADLTVTLFPTGRLDFHNFYRLTVNGIPPGGVTGATGLALDGKGNGVPGSDYVAFITEKMLAGPAPTASVVVRRRAAAHTPLKSKPKARAVDVLAALGKLTARPMDVRSHKRSPGHTNKPI